MSELTRTLLWPAVLLLAFSTAHGAERVDYERDVKPILRARCFSCHGALSQEAGLRLDTAQSIRTGGDSGAALIEHKPEESLLIERVAAEDEGLRMPPEREPLTPKQIAVLKAWIEQGAAGSAGERPEEDPLEHWAFQRPRRASLPSPSHADWTGNPIDRFVAAEHERLGLVPLESAEKRVLLRRVSLDLVGLPPSPEEMAAFLADDRPDAYERVVERLLARPQYGERWGRHWMDVWRYSDWYGRRQVGDVRNSYPHIWRWRDWIIRSLNDDKGYDQMLREMLAADELHPEDDTRLPALGYIVRNWFSLNYDTWKQDLVEHTAKAFLGLRLNCAHCHDHKYDPITQEEYFRFRAFFEPLELRHDRVPGGPPLAKYERYKPGSGASLKPIPAGLPRVYDLYHDEPTYMYRLGDTRDRMDRPPVTPAAPSVLGGDQLSVEPVTLPPVAWYPGLKPFVRRDELAKREAQVGAAEEALEKARSELRPLEEELAEAEQELADAKAESPDLNPPARAAGDLIAWWRFEGPDSAEGFLADSSGNDHLLHRVTGEDPPAAPYPLTGGGPPHAFFPVVSVNGGLMSENDLENRQAARFEQVGSFAYLASAGDSALHADVFTLETLVHFDVSQPNFNRTIADYEGCWTLLHRGLDEQRFELRLRYFNAQGELRDVATGQPAAGGEADDALILRTGHDYYVCLVMGGEMVTLWAADLTSRTALQSFAFPRGEEGRDFSQLARPAAETPFKIGNSDGTGRVVGLIDEVRYTRGALKLEQIAAAAGQLANAAVQQAAAKVAERRRNVEVARKAQAAAEARLAAARAEREAIEARIAADRAVYEASGQPADTLARAARAAEQDAKRAAAQAKLVEAERHWASLPEDAPDAKSRQQAQQAVAAAREELAALEKVSVDTEGAAADGTSVSAYTPLGPRYPRTSTGRRRALARWLTARDNPLAARVAVNHIWLRHFGRPLVETVFDFGRSGARPTHPALLDWLAVELMENGWSMKHLHRLIVTSRTYRLSSRPGDAEHPNFAIDRSNTSWWKFDRRRLEAESIRDSMLQVAGCLDSELGGPEIESRDEASSYRRSLYFALYPEAGGTMRFLTLFDPPDPSDAYRRATSIVPQQALALSNSELTTTLARRLAIRLSSPGKDAAGKGAAADDEGFIESAFQRLLCRPPSVAERAACLDFLQRQRDLYRTAGAETGEQESGGRDSATAAPAQRARESLVRALFSHNDFLTIH